jgi:hypothetical protein
MPGARCTRSLACELKKAHERSHHESTGTTRAFPHANGFNGFLVLSPVIKLSSHRRQRIAVRAELFAQRG